RQRVGLDLAALGAARVGEEQEASFVEAPEDHRPSGGPALGRGGGEHRGVGPAVARGASGVPPGTEPYDRIDGDAVDGRRDAPGYWRPRARRPRPADRRAHTMALVMAARS